MYAAKVNQGRGQKAAKANVEDKTALDDLDNLAFHHVAVVEEIFNALPSVLVLGALFAQHEATILVLFLKHEALNRLAYRDDLFRTHVFSNREFFQRNNAFRLEPDIHEHLVVLNLNDGTGNQVTIVKCGNRRVDEGIHLLLIHVVIGKYGRILKFAHFGPLSVWDPEKNGKRRLTEASCKSRFTDNRGLQLLLWLTVHTRGLQLQNTLLRKENHTLTIAFWQVIFQPRNPRTLKFSFLAGAEMVERSSALRYAQSALFQLSLKPESSRRFSRQAASTASVSQRSFNSFPACPATQTYFTS